jgi:hypothetical protein
VAPSLEPAHRRRRSLGVERPPSARHLDVDAAVVWSAPVIDPRAYQELAQRLEDEMARARALGLYRSAEKIHAALREVRAETPEAMPAGTPEVRIKLGPVREQALR